MHKIDVYMQNNPFEQLSNVVYDILAEEISSLKLLPGAKLNISKISDDLQISRTPVREAMFKLCEKGYVKKLPGKTGYYVSDLGINDKKKIFFIRAMLEGRAAYLCAKQKKCPGLDKLLDLADKMEKSYKDLDDITEYDYNFHKQIILSSENEYLGGFYNSIEKNIKRLMKLNFKIIIHNNYNDFIESAETEHKAIINAISSHMAELAEREIINHVNASLCNALIFTDKFIEL